MVMLAHPVDVFVGKQLRTQRIIMGLSQEALAKAVGITFQQVQKYERGINRMSASRLYDFSRVLNVSISFFFEGYDAPAAELSGDFSYEDANGVSEPVAEAFDYEQMQNRETLELMRCYHRIKNPAVKRRFVDLLRAVSDEKLLIDDEAI